MLSRRNDLRHEPDARMVEIEVYSTVGASWYELSKFRGMSAGKYGEDVVEVCGNGCGPSENGVKDVVKRGGQLTLRYHI